jgi:hypothetical protein
MMFIRLASLLLLLSLTCNLSAQPSIDESKRNAYIIAPPDTLHIEASGWSKAINEKLHGDHLVCPDGTIGLGAFGRVSVAGLTTKQVETALVKHLALDTPTTGPLRVTVKEYNSQSFYVVASLPNKHELRRTPIKGLTTIADVIATERLERFAVVAPVWIKRASGEIIYINRKAFTGSSDYTLELNDRLFVGYMQEQ